MSAMNMNAPTYYLNSSSTNSSIALLPSDANCSSIIVNNTGASAVAITSARGTAATATYPASSTVPVACGVVSAGAIETLSKNIGDNFISGINKSGATGGDVFIQVGSGE